MRPHLYILEGQKPVPVEDVLAWGRWIETADRRVALDTLDGIYEVSTVFMGVDHGHYWSPAEAYRPVLFETMVFKHDPSSKFSSSPLDQFTTSYSTWAGAEHGHRKTVEKVKRWMDMPM